MTADDPRGLLQLVGILPRDSNPPWTAALGKTDIKINVTAKPSATDPVTGFSINGKMGEFSIASDGSIVPALDPARTAINGSAEINSTSSAALINLYGGAVQLPDTIPARLVLTADGNFADNFLVDLTTDAYHGKAHFAGTLNPLLAAFGLNGDFTLEAANSGDLLAALQIPSPVPLAGALTLGAKISTEGGKVGFGDIDGKFGDVAFSGVAAVEDNQRISGDFTVDQVSLASLLRPAFLPWNGKPASLEQTFAKGLPYDLTGEVWVRPKKLAVYPGLDAGDAQIGLTASSGDTRLAVYAKTGAGEKIVMDIDSKSGIGTREFTGHVGMPVNLGEQLKLAGGGPVVSGKAIVDFTFDAKGMSPGGALATLNASGNYTVGEAHLLNISPQKFSGLIASAKDATMMGEAFTALHQGEGVQLGGISGGLNIVDGVATFSPFSTNSANADILVRPVVELPTLNIDMGVNLRLKGLPNLPPMDISYVGPPLQLVMNEDATALTSFLGFKVLEKGVGDLEKLQAEQQRLALEEEKMHKEDEAKLQAFYAQRAELRLRLRELRIQGEQRVLDQELAAAEQVRLIQDGVAMNKLELRQRLRELKAYRKVELTIPVQRPKPKPVEAPIGPLLLVPLGSAR